MMILAIYILVWAVFLYATKDSKRAPLYTFLLWFYWVGMMVAFVLYEWSDLFADPSNVLSLRAVVYHVCYLMLFFAPLKRLEMRLDVNSLERMPYQSLRPFLWVLIIFSLLSIGGSIIILREISDMTIDEIRTQTMLEGTGREIKESGSVLSHISSFASEYSYIALILAFYCIRFYPQHKNTIYLLFLSCLSYLFYNLEIGGREAIIRYVFDIIFVYFIFWKSLVGQWQRRLRRIAKVSICFLALLMIMISMARFVSTDQNSFISGTFGYFGQGFVYFSKIFEAYYDTAAYGQNIFDAVIPGAASTDAFAIDEEVDFATNIFPTFVGSFICDMGMWRALIPLVTLVIAMKIIARFNRCTIFYYIYVFWLMRFAFSGIFYWVDSFRVHARVYYFLLIFLLHLLYILLKQRSKMPSMYYQIPKR